MNLKKIIATAALKQATDKILPMEKILPMDEPKPKAGWKAKAIAGLTLLAGGIGALLTYLQG